MHLNVRSAARSTRNTLAAKRLFGLAADPWSLSSPTLAAAAGAEAADVAYPWDVGYVLDYPAPPRLPDGHHALLKALLAAINAQEP
jgi:hypothetical protein